MRLPSFTGNSRFRKAFSFFAVALIVGSISFIGVRQNHSSSALTPGQAALTIAPATFSLSAGATLQVAVNVSSGATNLNVVHAYITYPASQLQLSSTTDSAAFPIVQRTNTGTAGVIDIIRGASGGGGGVSGNNTVVTLNFNVVGTSGSVPLAFTAASEAFDNTGTGANVLDLSSSQGATFTIAASDKVPLYRMANWITHERLFTTSYDETLSAQRIYQGWVYEGIGTYVYSNDGTGRTPVYRMANWITHERLFTPDYNEVLSAQRIYQGWVYEGIGFYASTNTSDPPVYRLANWITHERLFTPDYNEVLSAQRIYPGWVYEGVGFYAAP